MTGRSRPPSWTEFPPFGEGMQGDSEYLSVRDNNGWNCLPAGDVGTRARQARTHATTRDSGGNGTAWLPSAVDSGWGCPPESVACPESLDFLVDSFMTRVRQAHCKQDVSTLIKQRVAVED